MLDLRALARMHLIEQLSELDAFWLMRQIEQLAGRFGQLKPVLPNGEFPVTQASDALGGGQLSLASTERLERLVSAQQIADPMGDQRRVDRLGNEVGGAHLVGAADGVEIILRG
ncbi:MAG: hypothetical protein VBE63_05835 [Lamprobacter sp.]|uniref:hypothetical protein n=1 Tax=Lamprobacter sp. TaxID=3100796 RepID=UPI002B258D8F|nr:hypothetical protein [Lamprobacter sp.]MEA3639449.1 hypothetical protein [Lamprobacter sp.]